GPGLRRLRAHGGRPRPRGRRHPAHARRPERASAVAVLGRRARRLGPRPPDRLPARVAAPQPGAPALTRAARPPDTHPAFTPALLACAHLRSTSSNPCPPLTFPPPFPRCTAQEPPARPQPPGHA